MSQQLHRGLASPETESARTSYSGVGNVACDTKCIVTRVDRCQAAAWPHSIDMYIGTEDSEYDHLADGTHWRLETKMYLYLVSGRRSIK